MQSFDSQTVVKNDGDNGVHEVGKVTEFKVWSWFSSDEESYIIKICKWQLFSVKLKFLLFFGVVFLITLKYL